MIIEKDHAKIAIFAFLNLNKMPQISVKSEGQKTIFSILFAISFAHLINDLIQAVIPAMYPVLKQNFDLTFTEIGLITFAFQLTSSIFQPFIGYYTDKNPSPFLQIYGMLSSAIGILLLSFADSLSLIVISVMFIGLGSSIFHPESSRISNLASGGKRGLAQSIFQVGGNLGTAIAPLLVAAIVVPTSQKYLIYFLIVATIGMAILSKIAVWYRDNLRVKSVVSPFHTQHNLSKKQVDIAVGILLFVIFTKFFYSAGISSYYTFYTIEKFNLSIQQAQIHTFIYFLAYTIGTLTGGFLGDRFGRKYIILFSVFGATPFAFLLPYANLFYTDVLMVVIGLIMSSAFPAIVVYAQELLPKKIGMISGLFYGFGFGMGAICSAFLGVLADRTSIAFVYQVCAFVPILGLVCVFLPNMRKL